MNVECLVVLESKEVFCKEYANVFVFLCCVTNNHKSSGLKQKSRRAQLDSLLKVSECWNQGGSKLGLLSEGSEEEPAAGLIQVVGWIQSMQLEDCGPCFLPGCWLRVVLFFCFFFCLFVCLFFQLLETPYISWLLVTSILQTQQWQIESISCFECPRHPLLSILPSSSATS